MGPADGAGRRRAAGRLRPRRGERAALAVAIDLLGQQHEEHLRARSRGAFLSDLADGRGSRRPTRAGAPRRSASRARAGRRRGGLLPVAASWRGTARPRPRRRADLDPALGRAAHGARLDRLRRADRPARRRPARAARARRAGPTTRRWPSTSPASSTACSSGAGSGPGGRGAGDRRAGRHLGWRPARAAARAPLCRARPPRCPRGAGTTPGARGHRPAARPARRAGARRVRRRAARPAARGRLGPHRALLETLEAYLAAGGRKAQAARALHLERQSLYLRLRRIEELLGVSLDDEDAVLGLHLRLRALRSAAARGAA